MGRGRGYLCRTWCTELRTSPRCSLGSSTQIWSDQWRHMTLRGCFFFVLFVFVCCLCRGYRQQKTRKCSLKKTSTTAAALAICCSCTRYSRDQLFPFNNTTGARLDSDLIRHLKKLSIGVSLPHKRSCRGGRRKQRKIEVVCGVGPPSDSLACPSTESGHVPPSILCSLTPMPPRPQGSNLTNVITVPLQDSATLPNQLCLCVFNVRSVGTSSKRSAIRTLSVITTWTCSC